MEVDGTVLFYYLANDHVNYLYVLKCTLLKIHSLYVFGESLFNEWFFVRVYKVYFYFSVVGNIVPCIDLFLTLKLWLVVPRS